MPCETNEGQMTERHRELYHYARALFEGIEFFGEMGLQAKVLVLRAQPLLRLLARYHFSHVLDDQLLRRQPAPREHATPRVLGDIRVHCRFAHSDESAAPQILSLHSMCNP